MLRVFRWYGALLCPQIPASCRIIASESNEGADGFFNGPIPREKLTISFARSSGPGGQNVNKLNTKAEIRLHVDSADWLPQRVKERLHKLVQVICFSASDGHLFSTRITKEGELVVTSQKHRTQHQNLEDAIAKLHTHILEAAEIPSGPSEMTIARVKLLKRKAERQRLTEKKYHSSKKEDRTNTDV